VRISIEERVPYLEVRRRGRKAYFYYLPKGSAVTVFGMTKATLATKAPETATFRERLEMAVVEAKALNAELARRRRPAAAPIVPTYKIEGTLPWLIAETQKHPNYLQNAVSTNKRTYEAWFPLLKEWSAINGHPDVRSLTTPVIQNFYEEIVAPDPDTGHRTLAKGRNVIATLKMLLRYGKAKLTGMPDTNAAEGLILARKTKRSTVWTVDQMALVKRKARELGRISIALAVDLGHDIGQRRADLVDLRIRQWNGRSFELRQKKTGELIEVPAIESLRLQMEELIQGRNPGPDDHVLVDENGKPYTGDTFYDAFKDTVDKAGLTDLWFHDLRRTCVVRLARAGLTIPQICAITGHTLKSATTIVETYLPRDATVAAEGIKKLEEYESKIASER